MGRSERDKGARGEREVAKIIESVGGFSARRGQVFNGEPDIVCDELPIHFEVKRQETLNITEWFKQAASACGDKYPAVIYKQNYKPWVLTMRIKDFLELTTGVQIIDTGYRISMKFDEFMIMMRVLFK